MTFPALYSSLSLQGKTSLFWSSLLPLDHLLPLCAHRDLMKSVVEPVVKLVTFCTKLKVPIHIPNTPVQSKIRIKEKLVSLLTIVDKIGVTRRQKLMIYKLGVCPRLNWPLTIFQFSSTWIERELEATATRFLKKWSGLAKSANTSILYLPKREGSLESSSVQEIWWCCCQGRVYFDQTKLTEDWWNAQLIPETM